MSDSLQEFTDVGASPPQEGVPGYCVATAPLDGVCTVHLIGEFDVSRSEGATKVISEAMSRCTELHLDLGEVEFLDSSALHVLIEASISADADDKRVVIVRTSPIAYRLLELSGLVEFFGISTAIPAGGS